MFSIRRVSRRPRREESHVAVLARSRSAARAAALDSDDERCASWHDSSHALLSGLSVIEHDEDDPRSMALAVALWLQ